MGIEWVENNLSIEERLSVFELAGHDLYGHFSMICRNAMGDLKSDKLELQASWEYVHSVIRSMANLGQDTPIFVEATPPSELLRGLTGLTLTVKKAIGKVSTSSTVRNLFYTSPQLLETALHNLIQNSFYEIDDDSGKITLAASDYFGKIENPVFQSPHTPLKAGFIKFNVNDNGPGFSKDRPFVDYLQRDVSTKEGGFGLHYVRMVAKVLRSHITIDSEPGNTNVTIYHPFNPSLYP